MSRPYKTSLDRVIESYRRCSCGHCIRFVPVLLEHPRDPEEWSELVRQDVAREDLAADEGARK